MAREESEREVQEESFRRDLDEPVRRDPEEEPERASRPRRSRRVARRAPGSGLGAATGMKAVLGALVVLGLIGARIYFRSRPRSLFDRTTNVQFQELAWHEIVCKKSGDEHLDIILTAKEGIPFDAGLLTQAEFQYLQRIDKGQAAPSREVDFVVRGLEKPAHAFRRIRLKPGTYILMMANICDGNTEAKPISVHYTATVVPGP